MFKDKERILKAAREKQLVTYKGIPMRLSADFSTETLLFGHEISQIMKSKGLNQYYSIDQGSHLKWKVK